MWISNDDKESYKTRIINISGSYDLCAIAVPKKLKEKHPNPLHIAPSVSFKDRMYVVGHPLLLPLVVSTGHAVLERIIYMEHEDPTPLSECNKPKNVIKPTQDFLGNIQLVCADKILTWLTNIPSQPGNSGSPTVNDKGEVVAVLYGGYTRLQWSMLVPRSSLVSYINSLRI